MTVNLRSKVTKSKRGTRKRPEMRDMPTAFRGYLHVAAFFMSPTFTTDRIPDHSEMLWHFARLLKPGGWEHLNHFQIKLLTEYCKRNNYNRWF